MILSTVLCKGK